MVTLDQSASSSSARMSGSEVTAPWPISATGTITVIVPSPAMLAQAIKAPAAFKPNAWVTIGADNIVTIVSPAAEMGQGVMTAMPALVAEDMDADWKNVRVVQAPADNKNYGNRLFGGAMVTGASRTTQGYYQPLRIVGAQTRRVLIAAAAELLKATPKPSRDQIVSHMNGNICRCGTYHRIIAAVEQASREG